MDIITKKAKKDQDSVKINTEELQERIIAEVDTILRSKEGHGILLALIQANTLAEKESQLVKLKTVIMESVSRVLMNETGYQGSRAVCTCGQKAKFVRYDEKGFNLLVGRVVLNRALYQCQGCGRHFHPLDELWELPSGHNSEGIERITALLGAFMPFECAEKVLYETSGISLSDSSIRKISEATGSQMESIIQTEIEKSIKDEIPEPEAEVMAIFSDGAMVNTREEQWKEVKVGAVAGYDRISEKELKLNQATYTAYLGGIDGFRPRLWAEAYRRGVRGREATLFLGDGSPWIWNLADELFPDAIQVLDYWHLCENVWKVAHLIFTDEKEKEDWVKEITENMLRKGKIDEAISTIKNVPTGNETQKAVETLINYVNNNRVRINYPALESKGYPIGSGIVESACKRIVSARHKQAGMRWSKAGVQKMLNLVSFIHSNRWDEYWKSLRRTA